MMGSVSKLEKKLNELSIQITNSREKRPKATNQRTNMWCSIVKDTDNN